MRRRLLATLVTLLIVAPPCVARSRTAAAVKAANDAKLAFHDQHGPTSFGSSTRPGAANRTLKVNVTAALPDGTLAVEDLRGLPRGAVDPAAIPEIVARDRSSFGGRKRLEAADLRPGQRLKLTFAGGTSWVLRAKVLKPSDG